MCVTEKIPVVVFFWDDAPDEWLSRLRGRAVPSGATLDDAREERWRPPASVDGPEKMSAARSAKRLTSDVATEENNDE